MASSPGRLVASPRPTDKCWASGTIPHLRGSLPLPLRQRSQHKHSIVYRSRSVENVYLLRRICGRSGQESAVWPVFAWLPPIWFLWRTPGGARLQLMVPQPARAPSPSPSPSPSASMSAYAAKGRWWAFITAPRSPAGIAATTESAAAAIASRPAGGPSMAQRIASSSSGARPAGVRTSGSIGPWPSVGTTPSAERRGRGGRGGAACSIPGKCSRWNFCGAHGGYSGSFGNKDRRTTATPGRSGSLMPSSRASSSPRR